MKIADKETAQLAKADQEFLHALKASHLGQRLHATLTKLNDDAFTRAMYGKTPQDQNAYFESRGVTSAVRTIQDLFDDIEKEGAEAINFLAALHAKGKDEG